MSTQELLWPGLDIHVYVLPVLSSLVFLVQDFHKFLTSFLRSLKLFLFYMICYLRGIYKGKYYLYVSVSERQQTLVYLMNPCCDIEPGMDICYVIHIYIHVQLFAGHTCILLVKSTCKDV